MKEWCPLGTMYTHADVLIVYRAALRRGDTVTGIHQCVECRHWHLGAHRTVSGAGELCRPAGKKVYGTERAARNELKRARAMRGSGDTRRTERFHYRCPYANGCRGWHLTSMERGEAE